MKPTITTSTSGGQYIDGLSKFDVDQGKMTAEHFSFPNDQIGGGKIGQSNMRTFSGRPPTTLHFLSRLEAHSDDSRRCHALNGE